MDQQFISILLIIFFILLASYSLKLIFSRALRVDFDDDFGSFLKKLGENIPIFGFLYRPFVLESLDVDVQGVGVFDVELLCYKLLVLWGAQVYCGAQVYEVAEYLKLLVGQFQDPIEDLQELVCSCGVNLDSSGHC